MRDATSSLLGSLAVYLTGVMFFFITVFALAAWSANSDTMVRLKNREKEVSSWQKLYKELNQRYYNAIEQRDIAFRLLSTKSVKTEWQTVLATREGLVGKTTASGLVIKPESQFVALPSRIALGRYVEVVYKNHTIVVRVEDVGPHSTRDAYWSKGNRPLAEIGKRVPESWMKKHGAPKNRAGLDLSDGLWDALGIPRKVGITEVRWRFASKP